jgi:hypothetical protein
VRFAVDPDVPDVPDVDASATEAAVATETTWMYI